MYLVFRPRNCLFVRQLSRYLILFHLYSLSIVMVTIIAMYEGCSESSGTAGVGFVFIIVVSSIFALKGILVYSFRVQLDFQI